MPRKIENPLMEGLPAKIYFIAFIDPDSGYKIAEKIYGYPRTAKIYPLLKQFIESAFMVSNVLLSWS